MLTDTRLSPYARMTSMPPGGCGLSDDTTRGPSPLRLLHERAHRVTIPTMGAVMFDPAVSHAYENFRVAAGDATGEHHGAPFMDGDFYKWLEAATVAAAETTDAATAEKLSDYVAIAIQAIGRAQQPNGYLHTKTIIAQRQAATSTHESHAERDPVAATPLARRTDFETYNFGHLMTAACIHHRVTGRDDLLAIARRVADYLIDVAATSPDRLADCNICPSHYMGVVELYRTTKDRQYLDLAGRLLDLHGGKGSAGSDDNQDVLPVRDQRRAVGHAVRANYLYAGMTDYAIETGDAGMIEAVTSIWQDLVSTKLYVTGGCGALYDGASPDAAQDHRAPTRVHQAYGRPYQLPNITAYNESCASLGFAMWAWRMLTLTGERRYADEIERVLYNALPAMIGADAKSYFYTNPLRQVRGLPFPLRRAGDPVDATPPPSDHRTRQEYMTACFCCPPNIARFIAELPYYVYSRGESELWVHQFVTSRATTKFSGIPVTIEQRTTYPASGDVQILVSAEAPAPGVIRVRIPGWADPGHSSVEVDGVPVERMEQGYAVIERTWKRHTITLRLPVRVRMLVAHHFLEEATNQVCVTRGPVVYCVESADLPEGVGIEQVAIPQSIRWAEEPGSGIFAGHLILRGTAAQLPPQVATLYAELNPAEPAPLDVRLVPYGLWGNRGPGEMSVWLPLLRS